MKKFLGIFLALVLTSFSALVYADAETHRHCVCGAADCTEKHEGTETVSWQAWDGDLTVGTADDAAAVYLYLAKDVTLSDTLDITNSDVYLCLNGKTLTIGKEGSPAVRVGENRKFVLCDCAETGKITGVKGSANKNTELFGAVNCKSGSAFVMYGGCIADNTAGGSNGGGVYANGGTVTIHGGSFKNNKAPNGSGGAISVENGKLYTDGGEMTGNSAINGGAIHLKGSVAVEIHNLKASGNTAINMGGAMYTEINGGSKTKTYDNCSIIEIHGSEFGGNTAKYGGGIYFNGRYENDQNASLYDTEICKNSSGADGGGIYARAYASLTFYGGNISENICAGRGGGVRMNEDTHFNAMNYEKNVYIKGNTANDGGGIYTDASNFVINNRCEIEGNTALSRGGGVYINSNSVWLIFTNTTVTKNTALQGGGIFLNKDDYGYDLEIGGGTSIIGNTSSESGAADNLYLNKGRMFQLRKGLNGSEKIGVTVPAVPTADEPVNIERVFLENWHDTAGDRSNLIIPDNDSYKVVYDGELKMHRIVPKLSLTLTKETAAVSGLEEPAVLYIASYGENGLLDIKKFDIESDFEATVAETGIKTTGATRLAAFLWDRNMRPVCAAEEVK